MSNDPVEYGHGVYERSQELCKDIVNLLAKEELDPAALSGTVLGLLMGTCALANRTSYQQEDMIQRWFTLVLSMAQKAIRHAPGADFEIDFAIRIKDKEKPE